MLPRLLLQAARPLEPFDRDLARKAYLTAWGGAVTAVDVSPIDAFVSHDERQSAAARLAGLRTVAPGARSG